MVHKNPGEPVLRILLFIPTMDVIYAYAITSKQDSEHILKSYQFILLKEKKIIPKDRD